MNEKLIRVGVLGVGRGRGFALGAGPHLGMQLVALCDTWEEKLRQVGKELNVTTYTDYQKFLAHDMDAVILANFFHEHAPFAIQALAAGKHVMSETAACFTLGEGVALIEAVEKSGKTYMFAENYPYMVFNQEMRRIYHTGKLGEVQYAEGEYIHPMSAEFYNSISCGYNHWRNWLPLIYYSTHALAPVMYVTDTWPTKVNGFIVPYDPEDKEHFQKTVRRSDLAWAIMLHMDNQSLVRLTGLSQRGHGNWYRFHCQKGLMENLRYGNPDMVRIHRESYDRKKGEPEEMICLPEFPEYHDRATQSGHGGGDFFMNLHFAQSIRTGKPPYFDVYRGVAMSIIGSLAYRSALNNSNTVEVPDFRKPAQRVKYKNDHWNPDPKRYKKGYPKSSILGDIKPPASGFAFAHKCWKKAGYHGE
ncbi:MAG: Gfo/Idh/MocA family oxidoreductase [Phycisphaerae bacterium]